MINVKKLKNLMSFTFNNDIETGSFKPRTFKASPVPNKKEESEEKSACGSCLICLGGLTVVSLILGLITDVVCYYVFGIKYLIDYKEANSECNSNGWDYILTVLICSFVLGGSQANSGKNEESSVGAKICASIIIGTWNFIETDNETCKEIHNTPLWTFANVISIVQIIIGCLTFIISCMIVCIAGTTS